MKCKFCYRPFIPSSPNAHHCKEPECVNLRGRIQNRQRYRTDLTPELEHATEELRRLVRIECPEAPRPEQPMRKPSWLRTMDF